MKTGQLGATVTPPSVQVGELAETLLELRKMTPGHLEQISVATKAFHQAMQDANLARSKAQKVQNETDAAVADLGMRSQEHDAKVRADGENLRRKEDALQKREDASKQTVADLATRERALAAREESVAARERAIERMRNQLGGGE